MNELVCGRCHAALKERTMFGGIDVYRPTERYAVDLCVPCLDLLEAWLNSGVAKPPQGLAYVARGEFGEIWLCPTVQVASRLAEKYGGAIVAVVERADFPFVPLSPCGRVEPGEFSYRKLEITLNAATGDPTRNFYVPSEGNP